MMQAIAKPARAEVTFCAIDRVGAQAYLVVCTTLDWRVYRLDKFSSARDSLTPVQIVLDDTRDGALLSNVRMLRVFRLPVQQSPRDGSDDQASSALQLGGFFVSEQCAEVDYSHVTPRSDSLDSSVGTTDSSEDLTILSFSHERILKQLPPTPSSVVDVQIQRSTAAVLCESHEILIVDLTTMCVQQRIVSLASLAVALGPRWIAYPGLSPSLLDDEDDSDDGDEFVPDALVHGGSRQLLSAVQSRSASISSSSSPPAYNAIDVAQNVASGIYFLSKSIAPYLSSSPGTQPSASNDLPYQQTTPYNQPSQQTSQIQQTQQTQQNQQNQQNALHAGWVVVQDLRTGRVVANFQCHATALVHLAFDFSGSLLATSSTKGQNVHVFRLLPPLQSASSSASRSSSGFANRHQLLYKLQRGITHASIADLAFSQDAKWLSVTSAHGTSHLYAIHPEGAAMSPHTHTTDGISLHNGDDGRAGAVRDRDVSDFCAALRVIEPKTLARVLKIHHTLQATAVAASNATPSTSYGSLGASSSTAASSAFYYQTPPTTTLMNTALDASQALFSQLAQSTGIDFSGGHEEQDLASRRRRRRRRMSCLFAHDGLKMVIYCDGTLKLYDLKVHSPVVPAVSGRSLRSALGSGSSSELLVKTRSSPFGFDATVSELKSWELLEASRVRTESLSSGSEEMPVGGDLAASGRPRVIEMRTFMQRGLPLWAHPKVSFRVIDLENPEGQLLQIKRKGPSNLEMGGDGLVHGGDDQQLFVMEMDSYFGLGGSPVFKGQSDHRVVPEVPRLDLAESMNLAISTSIKTPAYKSITVSVGNAVAPELTEDEHGTPVTNHAMSKRKKTKKHAKQNAKAGDTDVASSSDSSSTSTSASSSPTILQFTLQDMYFAMPNGAE